MTITFDVLGNSRIHLEYGISELYLNGVLISATASQFLSKRVDPRIQFVENISSIHESNIRYSKLVAAKPGNICHGKAT